MRIESPRGRVPRLLTTSIVALCAAAACRGPEPPAATPTESNAAPATQTEVGAMPVAVTAAPGVTTAERPESSPPAVAADQPTTSNPKPAPAACGRMPGDKIEKLHWSYGHDAECDRLETLWANVPHADLVCKTDDDCTVVISDGNCINLPISKAAAARKEYSKARCGNPMSGACAGHPNKPKCSGGCCGVE